VLVPLVPGRGFEPRSPVLQTGAVTRSAFRATEELVRTPVIETGPSEWRSETRPSSYIREAKRFRAKACPGLDPGWIPVRVKKTRQRKLGGKWRESNFRPAKGTAVTAPRRHQPSLRALPRCRLRFRARELAEGEGVEPSTFSVGPVFETGCSPPSATFRKDWASRGGSNTRPHGPEPCALPSELRDVFRRHWCLQHDSNVRHCAYEARALSAELCKRIGGP
jgi:hypothetical protein